MGHLQTNSRERGAWAPFVGVALAVLTAGSLVLFSFVAQRTSLDGFSNRGITAVAPPTEAPNSITLPGREAASRDTAGTDEGSTGTALLSLTPTVAVGVPAGGAAPATGTSGQGADARVDVAAGPTGTAAANDGPAARFDDGGFRSQFFRDGELRAATGDANGRTPKAKGAKAKGADKSKKAKVKAKKGGKQNGKGRAHKGRSNRRSARENKDRSGSRARSRSQSHSTAPSQKSTGPDRAAPPRPERSARPAPPPRPQPAPKAKSQSPRGHSNTTGKGHSKGRGRGHAHD